MMMFGNDWKDKNDFKMLREWGGRGPCKLLLHFEKPSYTHEKILFYVSSTLHVEIILVPWLWYEMYDVKITDREEIEWGNKELF